MKKIFISVLIFVAILLLCQSLSYLASNASAERSELKEALYYQKLDDKRVGCLLCPRKCIIPNKKRGFCRVRENRDGVLYSLVYAKPCAIHVDPIEKKPLFHVLPGTKSFSIATAGCNLECNFCQNWQISQAWPEDVPYEDALPEKIVMLANANNCPSIAYTYTEPTIFYEYMLDTARLAHQAGLMNVMHSCGFISEEPLRQLCGYMDAANIDLKGSDKFYNQFCLGNREDVLRTLLILKEEGVWLEITYLLIPTINDNPDYIKETCLWIKENLGPDTPLHISRFWPMYKLKNISPTPISALKNAYDIAVSAGLNYVYIGNIPGSKGESTYCPDCKKLLIKRVGYNIVENNIEGGKCKYCQKEIAGIWKDAEDTQEPSLAGSFYPKDPAVLEETVGSFIGNAKPKSIPGNIMAIISPHAGFRYSGEVAGYGFKVIKDKGFNTAIIVAPSHRHSFEGIAVLDKDFYLTPLGKVAIDRDITRKLLSFSKNVNYYTQPFLNENSTETQIPFVQKSLPGAKIVLILAGNSLYDTCTLLRDALYAAIGERKDIIIIASSDMSHYNSEKRAHIIDSAVLDEIEKFNPEELFLKFSKMPGKEKPCGSTAIIGSMMVARKLGADKISILRYATSADVTGDGSAVVGYASAVIYKSQVDNHQAIEKHEVEKDMEELLNAKERKRLLQIARETLRAYVDNGEKLVINEDNPVLNKEMGAFVTLHKNGRLRGCIGNIIGKGPLYQTISDMAVQAGTQDSRFSPVNLKELEDIDIEISVLSSLKKIDNPDEIIMGKHGVLIKSGFKSGVYLPQVAVETGWNREEFMDSLCMHKAGIPRDSWKNKECDIYIFSTEVFGEKEAG
jgi:pyruvate formate lyase activating enzyme